MDKTDIFLIVFFPVICLMWLVGRLLNHDQDQDQ